MSGNPYRPSAARGFKEWFAPLAISAALWWLSSNDISFREGMLAALLLLIPWQAYCRWQRGGTTRLPLFSMIGIAYWAAFAMPLFLASPPTDPRTNKLFSESIVFQVLVMTVLGVAALGAGMKTPFRPLNPARMPDISDSNRAWRYLFCVLALGTLLSTGSDATVYALGGGGRQLILQLASIVPVTICAILATKQADGTAARSQRYALAVFVAARAIIGISSGWLGATIGVGVILGLVYIYRFRKLPMRTVLILIPIVLFLQTGKSAFREMYWTGKQTGGIVDKARFWMQASWDQWSAVFGAKHQTGSYTGNSRSALFSESIDRLALLPQAANVLARTPRDVPWQNGASYSFLIASLVPRAVWPDKPSVNEANRFYQVAYGLTEKDNLDAVSISVGCLVESFMNFGWPGVILIMFAIGVILGFMERTLMGPESGLLFFGVGLALTNGLLTVEAQAAQYLGGQLQQIALVFVVFLPVIRRRKRRPVAFIRPGDSL